jgi:hypothetical protein
MPVTPDPDRVPSAEETARLQGRQTPAEHVRDRGSAADWTEARELGLWPPAPREHPDRAGRSRRTR